MKHPNILLGVLGGLGPMSTVYFCELLTAHTEATCDADHIDMLISSRASTPDRTAFILGNSKEDPLPIMQTEADRLCRAGAELLVIPCNTAHYFYDGLQKSCALPILNIIEETVSFLHDSGVKRFGLLATDGTVQSRSYEKLCLRYDMECITPNGADQASVMEIIYGQIKQNKPVDRDAFLKIAGRLVQQGCERIVLGCTELSLLNKEEPLDPNLFIDSLDMLAYRTILACNKKPIGFPFCFDLAKKER